MLFWVKRFGGFGFHQVGNRPQHSEKLHSNGTVLELAAECETLMPVVNIEAPKPLQRVEVTAN